MVEEPVHSVDDRPTIRLLAGRQQSSADQGLDLPVSNLQRVAAKSFPTPISAAPHSLGGLGAANLGLRSGYILAHHTVPLIAIVQKNARK
jgi:hypothetical protein